MNVEIADLGQRQSDVFYAIRFPLIVLVVFIHVIPSAFNPIVWEWSSHALYVFSSELISHYLGALAVPCFFLLSGYLFFIKLTNWSVVFYKDQMITRWRTLLRPYLLWNIIFFIVILLKNELTSRMGLPIDVFHANIQNKSVWDMLWGNQLSLPLNYPLWYVRDLTVTVLCSPIIYYWLKYLKYWGVLLLLIWYLSSQGIGLTGVSSISFFFFGLGAYFALYKKNILFFAIRYKALIYAISSLFLLTALSTTHAVFSGYALKLFPVFGVFAIISGIDALIRNQYVLGDRLKKISVYVFFIYAIHTIYIINWVIGISTKIDFLNVGFGRTIGYFFIGITTLLMSWLLAELTARYVPQVYAFLIGDRAKGRSSRL